VKSSAAASREPRRASCTSFASLRMRMSTLSYARA
jgi:hypothetical protein